MFGTAEFFEAELKKVAEQLRKSDDKLRILKQRYRYELPSEQETNLRTLDRLQIQKTANVEALDRYLTLQMNLERQISETPPRWSTPRPRKDRATGAPVRIRRSRTTQEGAGIQRTAHQGQAETTRTCAGSRPSWIG